MNYVISTYCERIRPTPPEEEYETLEEAASKLLLRMREQAPKTRDVYRYIPNIENLLRVEIAAIDDRLRLPLDAAGVVAEFRKHPSVRLVGLVYFYVDTGHYETIIHGLLQGKKEIMRYLDTDPGMQDLKRILGALDADAVTLNGVGISPDG